MNLLFATNNLHKLEEIRNALGTGFSVRSLKEAGIHEEIPESSNTLEGNAILKAQFIHEKYGENCFADDTGLEVDAINKKPGVFSSRYAGPECDPVKNMQKLLGELRDVTHRHARFRTIIVYFESHHRYLFEGTIEGNIAYSQKGNRGFGYDPLFIPEGFNKTFAEMTLSEKNSISHRSIALNKFIKFLKKD